MTIDKQSWGFRRDATLADMLTMEQLISTLASTVRLADAAFIVFSKTGYLCYEPQIMIVNNIC